MHKPSSEVSGWSDRMVTELTMLLGLTTLMPYLAHILPAWDDSPVGARLLPIFFAPLVAVFSDRPKVSMALAFIAPWANHLLLGMPSLSVATILTFELFLFTVILQLMLAYFKKASWMGPAAYFLVKPFSALLLWILPIVPASPGAFIVNSISTAWPGILLLGLIGYICNLYSNSR